MGDIVEGMNEALEITKGCKPSARVYMHGHFYVPENALRQARLDALEEAAEAVAYLRWQEVDPYDDRTLAHSVMTINALKEKRPE